MSTISLSQLTVEDIHLAFSLSPSSSSSGWVSSIVGSGLDKNLTFFIPPKDFSTSLSTQLLNSSTRHSSSQMKFGRLATSRSSMADSTLMQSSEQCSESLLSLDCSSSQSITPSLYKQQSVQSSSNPALNAQTPRENTSALKISILSMTLISFSRKLARSSGAQQYPSTQSKGELDAMAGSHILMSPSAVRNISITDTQPCPMFCFSRQESPRVGEQMMDHISVSSKGLFSLPLTWISSCSLCVEYSKNETSFLLTPCAVTSLVELYSRRLNKCSCLSSFCASNASTILLKSSVPFTSISFISTQPPLSLSLSTVSSLFSCLFSIVYRQRKWRSAIPFEYYQLLIINHQIRILII